MASRDDPKAKARARAEAARHRSNDGRPTARGNVKRTTTTTTKTKTTTTVTTTSTSYQEEFLDPSNIDDFLRSRHDPRSNFANQYDVADLFDPKPNPSLRREVKNAPLILSPKLQTQSPDLLAPKDEVVDSDDLVETGDLGDWEKVVPSDLVQAETPTMAVAVNPRATIRDQIFSHFLDETLLKSSVSPATSKRGMSYVAELLTLDLSSPMLYSAIEAHCLSWQGSWNKDKGALRDAEFAYGRVLRLLSRAIEPQAVSRPNRPAHLDRAIITSIMLAGLHMCARSAWHTHYLGVQQYLTARGTDALDLSNHFDRLLFSELRLSLFLICLAGRRPVIFDQPDWRKTIIANNTNSQAWYSIVIPLPTLLGRVDRLMKESPQSPHAVDRLAAMCVRLETMRDNITHWLHSASPYAGTAPQVVDIEDDDGFNSDIEEHCFMASSSAFDSYYRFPIVLLVFFPMNAWMVSLMLECTILRILHSPFFDPEGDWPIHRDIDAVHHDASIFARNLCRCFHAFSQLPSMVDACFLSVCTELVRQFYEESEDLVRVGWCQACAIATALRISRMKSASEQGALNVDYLKQGIGGAARWKSKSILYNTGFRQTQKTPEFACIYENWKWSVRMTIDKQSRRNKLRSWEEKMLASHELDVKGRLDLLRHQTERLELPSTAKLLHGEVRPAKT